MFRVFLQKGASVCQVWVSHFGCVVSIEAGTEAGLKEQNTEPLESETSGCEADFLLLENTQSQVGEGRRRH